MVFLNLTTYPPHIHLRAAVPGFQCMTELVSKKEIKKTKI